VIENSAPPVVLVADDEPTMLELVARHLRSIDRPKLEVIEASDGDEAWRLARERLPDLVVLDVMMPGMSGWEVCRKIRQDAALAHTGVLMLTGIGQSLNEATSPLFGADEYIDKPFDLEQLDERIVAVLERRAAQREAVPRPLANASKAGSVRRHHVGNGVGGPAKVATPARSSSKKSSRVRKAKPAAMKHQGRRKPRKPAKAEKGKKIMAAKKAKKGAKKAKKGAKKGKKK
jgi:DNA-binding response OmpR family regulator